MQIIISRCICNFYQYKSVDHLKPYYYESGQSFETLLLKITLSVCVSVSGLLRIPICRYILYILVIRIT